MTRSALIDNFSRRHVLLAAASSLIGFCAVSSYAAELSIGETGLTVRALSGDSFILRDNLAVRLAGIQAPRKNWPLTAKAKAALAKLIKDQTIGLYYGKQRRDRFGRATAQAYILDETGTRDVWLQAEMIRQGYARVMSAYDDLADFDYLYKLEHEAREQGKGIWADEFYHLRSPDPNRLVQYVDSVQIIEGIITSTADIRGRIYLNFGADYKTDFTLAIAKKHARRFKDLAPLSLEGAKVRVRGWIELTNGPMIWLDHPERLEVLD